MTEFSGYESLTESKLSSPRASPGPSKLRYWWQFREHLLELIVSADQKSRTVVLDGDIKETKPTEHLFDFSWRGSCDEGPIEIKSEGEKFHVFVDSIQVTEVCGRTVVMENTHEPLVMPAPQKSADFFFGGGKSQQDSYWADDVDTPKKALEEWHQPHALPPRRPNVIF